MCNSCVAQAIMGDGWDGDDSAIDWPVVTEAMLVAANAISDLYDLAPTGGPVHIVTDDYNYEDTHLDWCAEHADEFGTPTEVDAARRVIDALRPLSEPQRAVAIGLGTGDVVLTDTEEGER